MIETVDHIQGQTYHGRKGAVTNAFRYSIDYVMLNAEADLATPRLFKRNGRGLCALFDSDHGGAPGDGKGAAWVRDVLSQYQLPSPARIMLLAQPRFWNHVFNPVSFWVCYNDHDEITTVIAEVTNTFGERHSYLVHHPDNRPIQPTDRLKASKIFFVSPFQKIEGGYEFRFDISDDRIGIWIDYSGEGKDGLIATLTGKRRGLTNRSILSSVLRRPLGSRRVLALIHWQALKLWWKGAKYRVRPTPPAGEVSRG
ncbi:DUF1365 domain-containing protein [Aestuariivita boseongensis]|uniref:DUF1365 domain-containing protein n=1 Tax=Aestuariivita boseongensis TaxID=1470562 RepID=UPI000681151A|nr:DUF1365 domain-containing protein [Aestuariivita boseongensis]